MLSLWSWVTTLLTPWFTHTTFLFISHDKLLHERFWYLMVEQEEFWWHFVFMLGKPPFWFPSSSFPEFWICMQSLHAKYRLNKSSWKDLWRVLSFWVLPLDYLFYFICWIRSLTYVKLTYFNHIFMCNLSCQNRKYSPVSILTVGS